MDEKSLAGKEFFQSQGYPYQPVARGSDLELKESSNQMVVAGEQRYSKNRILGGVPVSQNIGTRPEFGMTH